MNVHRTNPFLLMAGLYLTTGLLAVVGTLSVDAGLLDPVQRLRWLTIHFVTIGGLTQALFGLLPTITGAVGSDEDSPPSRNRWLQWLLLNAGYPVVVVGMTAGSSATAVAGATLVLAGLGGLLRSLLRLEPAEERPRRYFLTAPWFLVAGILAAFGMLLGVHGPGGYFGSIEAHVHANVWGFLALVVAGTLLAVLPRLLDSELRYPGLRRVSYWGFTLGAVGLVAGPWLALSELTMLGLGVYVVGTVALLGNLVGTYRASGRTETKRFALVLGAYLWLVVPVPIAPFVLLTPEAVPVAAIERAAIDGLVFGWMLQLAMAFLPLATVAAGGGTEFLARIPRARDAVGRPSWLRIGSVNLGMLLLWTTVHPALSGTVDVLSFAGYLLIAAAWTAFVRELWSALAAPPEGGRTAGSSVTG